MRLFGFSPTRATRPMWVLAELGIDYELVKEDVFKHPELANYHPLGRIPAMDEDGNGLGGIRLPDIIVPLGTYQGFNPRKQEANASDYLARNVGSYWPFAVTKEEREKNADPRPSLEERYGGKEIYIEQVIIETNKLLTDRLLIQEDADRIIANAKAIGWPPVLLETRPFWK